MSKLDRHFRQRPKKKPRGEAGLEWESQPGKLISQPTAADLGLGIVDADQADEP